MVYNGDILLCYNIYGNFAICHDNCIFLIRYVIYSFISFFSREILRIKYNFNMHVSNKKQERTKIFLEQLI